MFGKTRGFSFICYFAGTRMVWLFRHSVTAGANTIYNSSARADGKSVVFKNMCFHLAHKLTAQMDKPATLDALEVEMLVASLTIHKLITGTIALANYHFFHNTLLFKLVKGTVNGGGADPQALLA